MDVRHHVCAPDALAGVPCDALLLIVADDGPDKALAAPLAAILKAALASGDFELKAGKSLYVHAPQGVKAKRIVFAAAGGSGATLGAKEFRSAVLKGLTPLKDGGTKHLAVGWGGDRELHAAHAEALATAVHDATYVYRHTK
ncbi:MAG: M17 family peptidase N-terminal domain-containing protein, partial [Burkholderiaceae bacterium]